MQVQAAALFEIKFLNQLIGRLLFGGVVNEQTGGLLRTQHAALCRSVREIVQTHRGDSYEVNDSIQHFALVGRRRFELSSLTFLVGPP